MTTTRRWAYIQETTGAQVLEKEDVYIKGLLCAGRKKLLMAFVYTYCQHAPSWRARQQLRPFTNKVLASWNIIRVQLFTIALERITNV